MKTRLYVATFLALALTTVVIADWPIFRGNSLQNGVATSKLPDALEIVWKVRAKDGVDGTLMNHRGPLFPPSGHGPHAALALKWLIASAPPEGRAPINRRAHLGTVQPSALSCRASLPLRSLASHLRLTFSSSVRLPARSAPSASVDLTMSHRAHMR